MPASLFAHPHVHALGAQPPWTRPVRERIRTKWTTIHALLSVVWAILVTRVDACGWYMENELVNDTTKDGYTRQRYTGRKALVVVVRVPESDR